MSDVAYEPFIVILSSDPQYPLLAMEGAKRGGGGASGWDRKPRSRVIAAIAQQRLLPFSKAVDNDNVHG